MSEVWSAGTYERLAARFAPVAEELVARLAIRPDDRVLDLATGTGEVLVAVDLSFAGDDRASVGGRSYGLVGDIRVVVERDGADERIAVYLDDDQGGATVLAIAAAATPGLPPTAALRVEQHSGRLAVWLDGAMVVDRALTAPEVVLMMQNDHGVVVEHAGDQVVDAWVLART